VHQKLRAELLPHALGSLQPGLADQRRNWLKDLHYLQSAPQHLPITEKRPTTEGFSKNPFLKWITFTKLY
jgi:hypothetical protein